MNINDENKDLETRVSSEAVEQNVGNSNQAEQFPVNYSVKESNDEKIAEIEKMVKNDLDVIRSLMEMGLVDRQQGQNLMKEVIENAYTSITTKNDTQVETSDNSEAVSQKDALAEFLTSEPEFFNRKGREDVLAYLKNSPVNFDKDELLQISELIKAVEKNAIDRYLQKLEYGKTLNDENKLAKLRLTANAQNSNANDNNMVFTRAQIGKMSGDEFAKYESLIMDQMRKGLIH